MSLLDYPLLATIENPADLRRLPVTRLDELARQLRAFLLETVAGAGGHLGAGLGTVELTLALHYVFDTPDDRLVWDVGHQTYPHKILTGRARELHTIRKDGGLAPFPKRDESPYDTFGVGHSSTSISAALGMAMAARRSGRKRHAVAVIGDGAMTAGMAFEALNHAGDLDADLLVVLNDNEMSISPNVGALSGHLARLLSGKLYSGLREGGKRVLRRLPPAEVFARRMEEQLKGLASPGTLFEELNFDYFGPVDGHDLNTLVPILRNLRDRSGPKLLHVTTRKGKGYEPAEADPVAYHGVTPFDPARGLGRDGRPKPLSYNQIFGRWLCRAAAEDPRVMGITPAMREGSGMVEFAKRFPEQYVDVAIAEQHAVTLAAGMACDGLRPVVAIYSTFLQRAYDQLIHDVALQNLPVLFAIDRAGLVGPDGPTHAGSFDLSFLRCIPNMVIMAPADEAECHRMLCTGLRLDGPSAVRYPRGTGPGRIAPDDLEPVPLGRAELRRKGRDIALLAFGSMVTPAETAAETLDATVVNMRFVKPLDTDLLAQVARDHRLLVTVEENVVAGGAGSGVAEWLAETGHGVTIRHIGLPDRFLSHGSREALLHQAGLDAEGIRSTVLRMQGQPEMSPARPPVSVTRDSPGGKP
ncbi:MAG: 1-deoxy-D-xylulose-5-phosphate synthase [Ectothiorhodospiraceae bacterium]|nr:1-deoxy-D-xylulose-5-phosphate synthase [Ectothiorhodospiraceae bacterium]